MKGITPIIAVILLLLMTVASAAAAYYWMVSVQGNIQQQTTETLSGVKTQVFEFEAVPRDPLPGGPAKNISFSKVIISAQSDIEAGSWVFTLYNGSNTQTPLDIVNKTGSAVSSGGVLIFTDINFTVQYSSGETCTLRVTSPGGSSKTKTIKLP